MKSASQMAVLKKDKKESSPVYQKLVRQTFKIMCLYGFFFVTSKAFALSKLSKLPSCFNLLRITIRFSGSN